MSWTDILLLAIPVLGLAAVSLTAQKLRHRG
ncbi:hypothetical protein ROTAS13_04080 [Roseomonas sp. TAS13]|uniref:Uncharacterized protein n=1 Tax=Roseomonas mucosa TaxID=207340 RepID=A0A379MVH3_9PROT|nr:hypothetical protein ROTAS13_04080 [Roseomonas sp. TAS13]SUE37911.1 Uncharacterised protein [Roseomonas mucosa]